MTDEPISQEMLLATTVLMQLTELRLSLKLDPDGCGTIGRSLAILGSFRELGSAAAAPGMPWSATAGPALERLRARLNRYEAVFGLIARPDRVHW